MRPIVFTIYVLLFLLPLNSWAKPQATENQLSNKVAIITGSSSGLGLEMVKLAIEQNMRLVLVDISPEASEQLAKQYHSRGGKALVVTADLSDPEQRPAIIATTLKTFGRIDYLFNNAGYAYLTSLADHDITQAKRLFEVNYWAYVDLAQRVLPIMLKQNGGYIINTSSLLGVVPGGAQMGVYAASKHALLGFFQSAAAELKDTGVKIKLVCPGGMKTNIITNAVGKNVAQFQHIDDEWEHPSIVAREIFSNLHDGQTLQFPSIANGMRKAYLNRLSR